MARPDAFSNHLERWVQNKCMKSIVFVELRPKDTTGAKVKELWDKCFPIAKPETSEYARRAHKIRLEQCASYQCSTGSVVRDNDGELWILTCAHLLGDALSHRYPITPAMVNELYRPLILCDHAEQRYQREIAVDGNTRRAYMSAHVTQVNRACDLMLLCVSKEDVQKACQDRHPPLRMARSAPKMFATMVMISWPVDMDRTAVSGKVAHLCRPVQQVEKRNPHRYAMKLIQVDMTSEVGSSGAPLLNGVGKYTGIMQSGSKTFSFFTSFADLRRVLTGWHVIQPANVI